MAKNWYTRRALCPNGMYLSIREEADINLVKMFLDWAEYNERRNIR